MLLVTLPPLAMALPLVPGLAAVIAAGATLLGAALSVTGIEARRAEAAQQRASQYRHLGLTWRDGRATGRVRDRAVTVREQRGGREVACVMAPSLRTAQIRWGSLRRGVDRDDRGMAEHDPQRELEAWLLADPTVRAELGGLSGVLEDGVLTFHVGGPISRLRTLLPHLLAACERLEMRAAAPWQTVAARYGLDQTPGRLGGEVDGREIVVAQDPTSTRVELSLAAPLDAVGIRAGDGTTIGDPVLDGRVHISAEAWRRLQPLTDERRAQILEIFHQYPESRAQGHALVVIVPGRACDSLAPVLEAASDLAAALSNGSALASID